MRYFLINVQTSQGIKELMLSSATFPKRKDIVKCADHMTFKTFFTSQEYIITNLFEFKNKKDYDSYLRK